MSLQNLDLDANNQITLKVKDHPFALTILKKEVLIPDQVPVSDENTSKKESKNSSIKG